MSDNIVLILKTDISIDGLKITKTKIEKVKSAKTYMLSLNLNHQEKCN